MYRLRTADKGKPLIISDKVLGEYSDGIVDTLHKKNLLSLGEDRYLTTLMTKHFPSMSYKFIPDAYASTAAPETWSVLLSQRRRWINSTIHNLAELVWLKEMCGFCCFSMRFVVFIDLFGTVILPATCAYVGYLIYRVATHSGQLPIVSLVMIAAVYGLQAIIFIIKRQWQHIGWMIIYIIAFPIYSFVLPVYSFWNQDNFSWGNTRIVIGEKGSKKIVAVEDDVFDPLSIPLQSWDDYAAVNNLPGRRGNNMEKDVQAGYQDNVFEMDDIHSVYSSVKPASTIVTGFQGQAPHYAPPQSPAPFANRQSVYSHMTRYVDNPQGGRQMSMNSDTQARPGMSELPNSDMLLGGTHSPPPRNSTRTPLGFTESRHNSTFDFQRGLGPVSDGMIIEAIQACLAEVDLDHVTKKQGKLTETLMRMKSMTKTDLFFFPHF
jgi:chitin synthase